MRERVSGMKETVGEDKEERRILLGGKEGREKERMIVW